MARATSIETILGKSFKVFDFTGIWRKVFAKPEKGGAWIIYGAEKNGKTWFSIKLAEYLSGFEKTLYVSAEEGISQAFKNTLIRSKIDPHNTALKFIDYIPLDELVERLEGRKSEKIVFIDNVTIYADELKYGELRKVLDNKKLKNKLFVFIAHEDKNEPYTATAKMIKRLAKIIVRVQGLACFVSGRCPGGVLTIDEAKAELYHGKMKGI